jgi:hypothetical protein
MIVHGLVVSEVVIGIEGIFKPDIFGTSISGIAGIGGNADGIVTLGIVNSFEMPGTPGIEGIGGKVTGTFGIVTLGIDGKVISKRWRASEHPLMDVKTSTKASNGQA